MDIPTLETFTPRELMATTKLNRNTKLALDASLFRKPTCTMLNNSGFDLPISGGTLIPFPMAVVEEDTDGMADIENGQIVIRQTGRYNIYGAVSFLSTNNVGDRLAAISVAGTIRVGNFMRVPIGSRARGNMFRQMRVLAGHTVQLMVAQTSGVASGMDIAAGMNWLTVEWVGPDPV